MENKVTMGLARSEVGVSCGVEIEGSRNENPSFHWKNAKGLYKTPTHRTFEWRTKRERELTKNVIYILYYIILSIHVSLLQNRRELFSKPEKKWFGVEGNGCVCHYKKLHFLPYENYHELRRQIFPLRRSKSQSLI